MRDILKRYVVAILLLLLLSALSTPRIADCAEAGEEGKLDASIRVVESGRWEGANLSWTENNRSFAKYSNDGLDSGIAEHNSSNMDFSLAVHRFLVDIPKHGGWYGFLFATFVTVSFSIIFVRMSVVSVRMLFQYRRYLSLTAGLAASAVGSWWLYKPILGFPLGALILSFTGIPAAAMTIASIVSHLHKTFPDKSVDYKKADGGQ